MTPITDKAEIPAFHPLKPVSEMMVLASTARELEAIAEELAIELDKCRGRLAALLGPLDKQEIEDSFQDDLRVFKSSAAPLARYQAMKEKAK